MKKLFKKLIKDDKIFGKYNVIDFLLVVIIVVCVAIGGFSLLSKSINKASEESNTSEQQKKETALVMKFYAEEINDFVASKLKVGSKLLDGDYWVNLGTATDIAINESLSYENSSSGEYTLAGKSGYKSALITAEVKGEKNDWGAVIGGMQYGVGHSMVLRVGDAKIYLRVSDISLKSDIEAAEKEKADKQKSVLISFEANEVNNIAVNSLKEGDELYDYTSGAFLGKIVSFEISNAKVYSSGTGGHLVASSKEGYRTVKITTEVSGEFSENGSLLINNKNYYLASEVSLRTGSAVLGNSFVTDIKLK